MRWSALTLIFATSLGFAGSVCPAPTLRQHKIRSDTIRGNPAQEASEVFARTVVFRVGQIAWVGTTDKNGEFTTDRMPPGDYRLEVSRWGSTTVQLDPKTKMGMGGTIPEWSLILLDNSCVVTAIRWE